MECNDDKPPSCGYADVRRRATVRDAGGLQVRSKQAFGVGFLGSLHGLRCCLHAGILLPHKVVR